MIITLLSLLYFCISGKLCFQVPFSFTPYSCVLFVDGIVVLFSDSSQLASDISLVRRKIMSSEYKATVTDAMCFTNRSFDSFSLSLFPSNDVLSLERLAISLPKITGTRPLLVAQWYLVPQTLTPISRRQSP